MVDPGKPNKKGGYGRRPLWHWILIYLVIGGILYYGIYYFYTHRSGGTTNTKRIRFIKPGTL